MNRCTQEQVPAALDNSAKALCPRGIVSRVKNFSLAGRTWNSLASKCLFSDGLLRVMPAKALHRQAVNRV
jgi:hypothetical protein